MIIVLFMFSREDLLTTNSPYSVQNPVQKITTSGMKDRPSSIAQIVEDTCASLMKCSQNCWSFATHHLA